MPQPLTIPINKLQCQWLPAAIGVVGGLLSKPDTSAQDQAASLNKQMLQPQLQAQKQFLPSYLNAVSGYLNSPGMNNQSAALGAVNSSYAQGLKASESKLQGNLLSRGLGSADATSLAPLYSDYAQKLATAQREVPQQMALNKVNFLSSLFSKDTSTALSNLSSLANSQASRDAQAQDGLYAGLGSLAGSLAQLQALKTKGASIMSSPTTNFINSGTDGSGYGNYSLGGADRYSNLFK